MADIKIFISSVQAEFSRERRMLYDYIRQDALLGQFFEPFIFEMLPAVDVSAPQAYLKEAPEFIQEEDFCTILWRRERVHDKANDKVGRVQLTINQRVVYSIIKDFDKVNDKVKPTTAYIAQKTNLSYPTVQRIVAFLVKNGMVRREGSDKTGFWVACE